MAQRAGGKKFQRKSVHDAPTIRKLLCFMLLPHNGIKRFEPERRIWRKNEKFHHAKVENDDDGCEDVGLDTFKVL